MKYSKFIEILENKGYKVDNFKDVIGIKDEDGYPLCTIEKAMEGRIDVGYSKFHRLYPKEKFELFILIGKLLDTPLDEREDEKRYRLRLPFIESYGYLNLDKIDGIYELSDEEQVNDYQTIFTESEIAELKEKYNLDSFVLEEVKEDE